MSIAATIESFDILRALYRVSAEHVRTRDELIALLDLAPLLDVPVRQLSLGQRMRRELAASLLHAPRILYLGHIAPADAFVPLVHQAVWTVALVILGRGLLRRGTRRLVVQKG